MNKYVLREMHYGIDNVEVDNDDLGALNKPYADEYTRRAK